jgi:hypothetical protein
MDPCFVCFALPVVLLWSVWYGSFIRVTTLASSHLDRLVLYLAPLVCLLVFAGFELIAYLNAALPIYFLALFFWLTALGVLVFLFPWLGLSPRDDVAERRNRAAGWAIACAMLSLTLACGSASADTADWAPEWRQAPAGSKLAVLPALSMVAVFPFWAILESLTGLADSITVERDAGAALRLGAFLMAQGLLVGQAAARLIVEPQSWNSPGLLGPPVLLVAGVVIERRRRRRPGPGKARPTQGDVIVALFYMGFAALWIYTAR